MAKSTKSEKVPKAMQATFNQITAITDNFAAQHLNDEYATLMRQATAALCRKRPSPLKSGRDRSWACGIAHAIGMANFLFDPSQNPHISASDLYAWFGVSSSTGQSKSKTVRDLLDIGQLDPEWCLPSKLDDNPLAWLLSVNGMIIDARSAPPEVQEKLAAAGLIPYVQTTGAADELPASSITLSVPSKSPTKKKKVIERAADALYVLEVDLIDGPITDDFAEKHPRVARTIEIKGSQTLKSLHRAIFSAFDRQEEHLYEFMVGGDGPADPDCQTYGPSFDGFSEYAGDTAKTSINSLSLMPEERFGYVFDLGDDWWHVLEVKAIHDKAPKGKYPRVTEREGKSPPQYADFD